MSPTVPARSRLVAAGRYSLTQHLERPRLASPMTDSTENDRLDMRDRDVGTSPRPLPLWQWATLVDDVEVRFLGRTTAEAALPALVERLDPRPPDLAHLVQIHSDRVVEAAEPGIAGEGDALVSSRADLALAVATADCVPVLLAAPGWLAAVHAGWRGLVAGVIPRTLERADEPTEIEAWIGPAIGRCCYEVSTQVAQRVAEASTDEILAPGAGARPHIDLRLAATHQLTERGVESVHQIDLCTHCHGDELWSYRRDGSGAGRNWALIWRRDEIGRTDSTS